MIAMLAPLQIVPLLLACVLAGCSSHILEEVAEIAPPRDCAETTKIFNTFSMRATSTSWKGAKSDPSATLALELVFINGKKLPIALSNSGAGVLYTVEFSLQGSKGISYKPKETAGVTLPSDEKKLKEAKHLPFFGQQKTQGRIVTRTEKRKRGMETVRDVNFRIRPGETEEGKLVFQAPRDNYLLTIERKFAGKPVAGTPTDHIAVCKIAGGDMTAVIPPGPPPPRPFA